MSPEKSESYPYIYMISGDPPLAHHIQTWKLAQKKLSKSEDQEVSFPLMIVQNKTKKKSRLFSPKESLEILQMQTQEKVDGLIIEDQEEISRLLNSSRLIVRRMEKEITKEYLEKLGNAYNCPDFIDKTYWVRLPEKYDKYTSGRFKALVYNSIYHSSELIRIGCHNLSLEMAPELVVQRTKNKIKKHPADIHFLSICDDIRKILKVT